MALVKNAQASFTAGELAPSLHSRVDLAKYRAGVALLENWLIHPHGGVSRRGGLRYIETAHDANGTYRLVPFEAASNDTYVLEFGEFYMRVFRNGVLVRYPAGHAQEGQVFVLESPYGGTVLDELVIEQSNDVLSITHEAYQPREIVRYDHHDWRVVPLVFAPSITTPSINNIDTQKNFTSTAQQTPAQNYVDTVYTYVITAVHESGEESLPSAPLQVINDLKWYPSNVNTIVNYTTPDGTEFINVYREENGLYGFIGTAPVGSVFIDKNYKPDLSVSPPQARNPFSKTVNWPRASTYYQQRRIYGGTTARPQTFFGSVSGNFYNFSVSRPARDNDALEGTLAARSLQKIRHFVAMADLVVFTESAEWRVRGTQDGIISPSSLRADPQSYYGSGDVAPLVVGDQILFVLRDGKQVRDLGYKFESDNYSGSDLTILSNHLFKGRRIRGWAHQRYPDSTIWCWMDDGTLISLTYLREHEVWGWARHATDGLVRSVAVVSENNLDVPYLMVQRSIGGIDRYYIERLEPAEATSRAEAFFVDSGLSYHGAPVSVVTGLGHLEGRHVVGLADGGVIGLDGELTVIGGAVTLPYAASVVHLGLPYSSVLKTLAFTLNDRVTEGVIRGVGEVTISVMAASGIEVGPDFEQMSEHKAREFEDYGTPPELKTGHITIPAPSDYTAAGQVCLRQRYPLPTTILAIAPEIDYAG